MFGLVDRGAERRPDVAARLRGVVVLRFEEGFAPLQVRFAEDGIEVGDGEPERADVEIRGSLPDVARLLVTRRWRGIPNPLSRNGIVALSRLAGGRLRIEGDRALAIGMLELLDLSDSVRGSR